MFINHLRPLRRNRRGSVAVMIAVMAAAIIGFASLGAEFVDALMVQRKMQAAADSAAISAANAEFLATGGYTGCEAACSDQGLAIARADGFTGSNPPDCLSTTVATLPFIYLGTPCDGPHAGDNSYVEAFVEGAFPLRLAHVLYPGNLTLHGRAVAHIFTSVVPCALALAPSGKDTVKVDGGTKVTFQNCGLAANSTDPNAVETNGSNSSLSVSALMTSGNPGYNAGSGTISAGSPSATPCNASNSACMSTSPPALNPYAYLANLAIPCSGGASQLNAGKTTATTASPGCYTDLKMSGQNCSLTLNPGTYYLSGSVTDTCPSGTVQGTGVTIVLTGASSSITLSANTTVKLSAQTSGDYSGVLFYSASSSAQSVLGGANTTLTGALVFPQALVKFAGNVTGSTPNSPCTTIIAWKMDFTGGSALDAGCTNTGVKQIVEPAALVE